MTLRRLLCPFLFLLVTGVDFARAQDAPKIGLTMGYPAAFGVLWHVSDSVALRPEIAVTRTTGNSTTPSGDPAANSSSWSVGAGASALFYLTAHDALRTYLSPRFTYTRNSAETEAAPGGASQSENWSNTYALAGSFGAEYALARRFSVFGEIGVTYSHQTSGFSSSVANVIGSSGTGTSVGTRSAVGVMFYF